MFEFIDGAGMDPDIRAVAETDRERSRAVEIVRTGVRYATRSGTIERAFRAYRDRAYARAYANRATRFGSGR